MSAAFYLAERFRQKQNTAKENIIKSLIYGFTSSGNQAEGGLRETAKLSDKEYPLINQIVQNDIYVDDCLSGKNTELSLEKADQLELVLNRGGFSLKGVTFSKRDPPNNLSADYCSVNVARMKWFPKEDMVSLDIGEFNFAKKQRGQRTVQGRHTIPFNLKRRQCVSKVAEIFDLTGNITPITATMKLDLHTLVERGLYWDDRIPDDLKPILNSHFEMLKEISKVKLKHAVVPEDAMNPNINTIGAADGSQKLASTAIYARFLKKDGTYSCQLVFSRSKIIPDGVTQPRAELFAATMNTHTDEIVRRAFQSNHKERVKLSDSQVTLFWINNQDKPVNQWVQNSCRNEQIYTTFRMDICAQLRHVADLGTRRVNNLGLVSQDSTWINGFSWMKKDKRCFPAKTDKSQ